MVLPGIQKEVITADRIITELTEVDLAIEAPDGWLASQLRDQERGASYIRDDVRRFSRFIQWLELNLDRFGLEDQRPKMAVCNQFSQISLAFCNFIYTFAMFVDVFPSYMQCICTRQWSEPPPHISLSPS